MIDKHVKILAANEGWKMIKQGQAMSRVRVRSRIWGFSILASTKTIQDCNETFGEGH